MTTKICLGIDPGLARLGWGLVVQEGSRFRALTYGCIETSPRLSFLDRLLKIYTELDVLLDQATANEKAVFLSIERLFFGNNITTAEYVWQARGVIMLLAAQHGLMVFEPKPNEIKLALCGSGRADKTQIQRMVQRFLNLSEIPKPDDTADALAAAITGLALACTKETAGEIKVACHDKIVTR